MIDDPLNRTKVKRGSQLPQSKLSEDDVRLIRLLLEDRNKLREELKSLSNRAIGEKFGVKACTIDRISSGGGWAHV